MFKNDYNGELWKNHTSSDVFWMSYTFTAVLIIFGYKFFTINLGNHSNLKQIFGFVLTIAVITSIIASIWLFVMHQKHIVVGYSEWIKHCKGLD